MDARQSMVFDGLHLGGVGLLVLLCLARQTRQAPVLLAEQEEIVIVEEGGCHFTSSDPSQVNGRGESSFHFVTLSPV